MNIEILSAEIVSKISAGILAGESPADLAEVVKNFIEESRLAQWRMADAQLAKLRKENSDLRSIFPKICEAIGNGSACSAGSSIEFLKDIPKEIRLNRQDYIHREKVKELEDFVRYYADCKVDHAVKLLSSFNNGGAK